MILLIHASGMIGMSGPLVAVEMIADEQRLSSFADAIIGLSPSIINDLTSSELTNSLFRPTPTRRG